MVMWCASHRFPLNMLRSFSTLRSIIDMLRCINPPLMTTLRRFSNWSQVMPLCLFRRHSLLVGRFSSSLHLTDRYIRFSTRPPMKMLRRVSRRRPLLGVSKCTSHGSPVRVMFIWISTQRRLLDCCVPCCLPQLTLRFLVRRDSLMVVRCGPSLPFMIGAHWVLSMLPFLVKIIPFG